MHRQNIIEGASPPEVYRSPSSRPQKRNLKAQRLALLVLTFCAMTGYSNAVTCDQGFYLSSNVCYVCEAGYYCSSNNRYSCSSGYYCPYGSQSQIACPAGFYCSSTSIAPRACDISTGRYSTGYATSCSSFSSGSSSYSATPKSSPSTCAASNLYYMNCPSCPAGYTCSGGYNTQCYSTSAGYIHAFANTYGSCTTNSAGTFGPRYQLGTYTCPDYTYSYGGNTACTYISAGYSVNAAKTGMNSCDGSTTQSGFGSPVCSNAPVGYYIGSGQSASSITMRGIPQGYYKASVSTSEASQCGATYECTTTAKTSCPVMKYSLDYTSYCQRIPIGYYVSGTSLTACSGTAYDKASSSCQTCSYNKCDQYTGLTQTCPTGWYFSTSTTFTCSICTVGYYCTDGVSRTKASASYPEKQTGGPLGTMKCPAGYFCNFNSFSMVPAGDWSAALDPFSTEEDYVMERDLTGADCPSSSYQTSVRIRCAATLLGKEQNLANNPTDKTDCTTTGQTAWIGEECESMTINQNYQFASDEMAITGGVHCPTGYEAYMAPGSIDYECKVRVATSQVAMQYIKGVATSCPQGDLTITSFGTQTSVTHWHQMTSSNEAAQCQDCPPGLTCLTSDTDAEDHYCVGKDPSIDWYDANNSNLKVQMDDRRVSQYENYWCFDCNAEEYASGICTFSADYFPDHYRTSYSNNDFLENAVLDCPFQSTTRTQARYLDSVQWQRLDEIHWTYFSMEATDYSYTTYAFFDDTENNIYQYSYCDRDENYFTDAQVTSHSEFQDSTEIVNTECTLYEYFSPNFPMCVPAYGGFISDTDLNQPTETAVPDGYMTQLTQNDDYTGIKLVQCPEFTEYLMVEGGTNQYYACHIKDLGSCKDSTSDYCNNGQDYICPDGFNKKTSGTFVNNINDCESCSSGTVCSSTTTETLCPDGYNCEAMTSDVYSKPGQPGELLTRDADGINNSITVCTGGYCEGATYSGNLQTCPEGYYNTYSGTSASGQHSQAGCSPVNAGTYTSSATTCTAGQLCPMGSITNDIDIPPGYYSSGTGKATLNDVSVCTAGKFCDFASTSDSTDCPAGSYCLSGTVFKYDTTCGFGSTSSAGSSSSSDCSACTDGEFCQDGSESPLTDGSYCANDNFLCIGGDLERTTCADGQYTANGATCSTCPSGQFCTPGIAPVDCSAGYESAGSLSSCGLSSPGQITSGGTVTADATDGQWTIDGQTAEFNCPSGYHCASGVITGCENGEVCAEGSSAATTAAAGTVGDEVNLFYEKPCPAGYECPASSTRAEVAAGQYSLEGYDGSSATYCADGYSCATGSIGPYQSACEAGTHYYTGTASDSCVLCAIGSHCYQGVETACEPGFYCDVDTSPEFHQQCPLGTYSLAGSDNVECTECDGGYACVQRGLTTTPTYVCGQGYFCLTGSTSTQPERIQGVTSSPDDSYQCDPNNYSTTGVSSLAALLMTSGEVCNQGVCPRGYYCPEGTHWPKICPVGTFNLNYGEVSSAGCIDCIEGYYCPTTLEITTCDAGTVCPAGQDNQDSVLNLASPAIGSYSLTMYPVEIPCYFGTYQGLTGQSSCDACDAGSQCSETGLDAVQTCDLGSDCSASGTIVPKQCYYGQYLDPSNAVNPNCVDCPENQFCWSDAIIEADILSDSIMRDGIKTSGVCPSGYKCVSGATIFGMNLDYSTNPTAYMCREGYYCDNSLTNVETECPTGQYMPRTGAESSSDCLECKPGFECSSIATSVPTDCPSGYFCTESTVTTIDQCQPGGYCPDNAEMEFECPYGYYADSTGMTACTIVAAGYYVTAVAQSSVTDCPVGYYCLQGCVTPAPCPSGQTSVLNTQALLDCYDVSIGEYRSGPTVSGAVTDGYNAPTAGEYYPIPTRYGAVCSTGSYCIGGVMTDCAAGTRCENEQTTANVVTGVDECDAGFYCIGGTNRRRPLSLSNYFGDECTTGYYCPLGSSTPTECPIGFYSDALGLQSADQCHKCKNGMYCPTAALAKADMIDCPAGYYCVEETSLSTDAAICDNGMYCPVGALEEIPCVAGEYQDLQGQDTCKDCEIGNYCAFEYTLVSGTSQKHTCPVGYACVDTNMYAPTPCSIGYYQDTTGSTVCTKCPAGYYCPYQAVEDYTAYPCPEQFVCPIGTSVPELCVDGYLCNSGEVGSQEVDTLCPAGYYCIAGYKYVCYSGYLCIEGATTPAPVDGSTGQLCDQGYWCEEAATAMTECGIGYYNAYFGASTIDSCLVCPSGTDCPLGYNSHYTYIDCAAGWICDSTGNYQCDQGMYCPSNTLVMLKCPSGTYAPLVEQSACTTCPEGYYCETGATVGVITPADCPNGHYCPEATGNYEIFRCPVGTYHDPSDGNNLNSSDDCQDCPETYYCPQVAMYDTAYLAFTCQDGYLCEAGSTSATGSDECPRDYYCVAGVATHCPTGYYSTATGLRSNVECVACSPGKICPNYSSGIYSCPEGNYCPGLITNEADMTTCPAGSYCPAGSGVPVMCEPGTYQDLTGQIACTTCTAGSYCPDSGLIAPTACSTSYGFYYCPKGSIFPGKCPIGYFVENQDTCTACGVGEYCWPEDDNSGDGVKGTCEYLNGYLCRSGSYSPRPLIDGLAYIQAGSNAFLTYNGPVLGGWYSIADGVAVACDAGTWQPSILSQGCIDCYEGRYCPNTGMSELDGYLCAAGYWCGKGQLLEEPPNGTVYATGIDSSLTASENGGLCPIEYECSYTLIHQMRCEDGYISEEEGLAICSACPSGYYCDMDQDTAAPIECITQSVCSGGEKRQPICPAGTFMNEGDEYCQKCTAGNYCRAGIIAEECAAGFLCDVDDFYSQPDPGSTECEVGWYCPKGNTVAIPCPFETQSTASEAKQATDCVSCQPGWLCPYGERNATECPAGYYCPPKADDIIYKGEQYACAVGTYNPWTKKIYQSDCLDCVAGSYCNTTAIADINGLDCPQGHFCPLGTNQPMPCRAGTYQDSFGAFEEDSCEGCPIGFYCPQGAANAYECEEGFYCPFRSAAMVSCSGGFYCNADTRYQEIECPINSYCPRGSAYPLPCDDKHTCPGGTEEQIFCTNGYYVDTRPSEQYGGQNICKKCPIGTYSIADTQGCLACPAGYLCYGATNSNTPHSITYNRGEICPKGAYCPEGSYDFEACPPGTYNQNFGAGSLSQCTLCAPGSSQSSYGQEGCSPCGQFADSNEGAKQCTCVGKNRVYSPVDNSCRCRTGYDFKNTDSVSEGQSSDVTDCIPLVLDRCDGDQVRTPDGQCISKSDCTKECNGGIGTRDDILGVCSCEGEKTTDEICDQACRSKAPKMIFTSSTDITMTINGVVQNVDLTQAGDVFGKPTGTGDIKSVSMSSTGFKGSYGASSALNNAATATEDARLEAEEAALNATRLAKKNRLASAQKTKQRRLQSATPTEEIPNPVYCIREQDTFLYTIENPTHYPVYMKDSVMNNNLQFDYGSFIDLATEMKRKAAQGLTTGSVFSFTFTTSGNYVFQDAADSSSLMIISVKGSGENCADPDRFLQVMSGETLSQFGVAQRKDVIQQPNYPLIVSMTLLMLFGTGFTMWMVQYCMRKGWFIKEMRTDNYRETQLQINIHHENEKVFIDNNDFVQHKSALIDHQEDDLDGCNLDIQQDLVDAGKKYLHTYNKRKNKHKKAKIHKKKQIEDLMQEVESLVTVLNSDSTAAQMHWLDLELLQEGAQIDDKTIKKQIEKQMAALNKQEEAQNENYKLKKEELLKNASERERLLHEKARERMLQQEKENSKHFGQGGAVEDEKAAAEYAIYDNGDVKTKNNQLVLKIEQNQLLNDEEKEKLLQQHENRLHTIDNVLEQEKRKQEQELDRALKERLDRRHRLKDKQHGKEIRKEQAAIEKEAADQYESKKEEQKQKMAQEHDEQVKEILTNSDLVLQRQQLQALEELTEQKKRQAHIDLEQDQSKEVEARKDAVSKKYMNGQQNEEDLSNELKKLMGDQASSADAIFTAAHLEKEAQEAKLSERLAKRHKNHQEDLQKETDKVIAQVELEDVVQIHEREVVATEAHLRLKQKALLQDGNDGLLPTGCLGLDSKGLPITDAKVVQAADVARKEAEERKEAIKEIKFRLNQDIDTNLQSKSLLTELEKQDASLALLLKQQDDKQNQKLEARRAHLKARRLAKIKDELEEKTVIAKIDVEEEKQAEHRKITEDYVRKLFKNTPRNETTQQRDKRLEILNEYLSDEFLEELSNLLMKQFMETDAYLKMTLHKYMQEGISETEAIKTHFKIDQESLEELKPHMSEAMHNDQLKKLKLNEANLLKTTSLNIQKCHTEEEARIRKELDKKHMQEQVELRVNVSNRQAQMRMQLIGESQLGDAEHELDKKALERFQQMKFTEQERRIRAIELQKKTLTNETEAELKQQFSDYDEMVRRKKQKTQESADQELSLRKRIQERKEKLRKNNAESGMTQEEKDKMLKNYQEQLSQLDSAYMAEQRRQQLIMKTKLENRQKRMIKVHQLKKELEKSTEAPSTQSKLTNSFAAALRKQMFKMDKETHVDDQSELYLRLKEWDAHKRDYELMQFAKKASEAGMVELDENQIKIMIIKLQQIEKLLKEVGRQKKLKIKGAQEPKKRRRSSVSSTLQSFIKNKNSANSPLPGMSQIAEDEDGNESDQQRLLSKQGSRLGQNNTAKRTSAFAQNSQQKFAGSSSRQGYGSRK